MRVLSNDLAICDCRTDRYTEDSCPWCDLINSFTKHVKVKNKVERCLDCGLVKAADCEHYDMAIHNSVTVKACAACDKPNSNNIYEVIPTNPTAKTFEVHLCDSCFEAYAYE